MTGVAAQLCTNPPLDILGQFPNLKARVGPRACILNDLSPAACHIAYNYNTPVDIEVLKREFERIMATVRTEFDWLYGTEHYEPALGLYDPSSHDVVGRLKNPTADAKISTMFSSEVRSWELLTKAEVEKRLAYSVTELPLRGRYGDLDVSKVEQWICIPATIQYTIWSDVYRCEGFVTIEEPTGKMSTRGKNAGKSMVVKKSVLRGCGKEIVLWDAAVNKTTEEVAETFACPNCEQTWEKKKLTLVKIVPVMTDYKFIGLRSRKTRSVTEATFRTSRRVTRKESDFIAQITGCEIPYWYPRHEVDKGREMLRHGLLKRGIQNISDFYTKRNLWAMARLWTEIESAPNRRMLDFLRFTFTSIIPYVSLKQSYGGGGGGLSSTLYIASLTSEKNVLEVFKRKAEGLLKSLPTFSALAKAAEVLVRLGSADALPMPDKSVDYIFADPPFGSNIFYADCSLLWETWIGQLTDESKEMVINDRRVNGPFKTLQNYSAMMTASFREMFRVLKPGRWATIEFNNSDGRVFEAIKRAVAEAGFEIVNMLLLDKAQKSFKQVKGAKGEEEVVDKDVVFNLRKPSDSRAEVQDEDYDLEQQVADAVRSHLLTLPDRIKGDPIKYGDEYRTTATINSMLMNTLIPRGVSVSRLNLQFIERVCGRYFRKVGQHWYLRGEAAGGNGSDVLFAEEVAIADELTAIAWLRQRLQSRPMLIGEIKPLWMRATGLLPTEYSHVLILEDMLSENFWRDADTNHWREPTEEERERMNDDRSIRVLHDAERFVGGALRRITTDTERCDWVEVLFNACKAVEENETNALPALRGFDPQRGYRLISRLFQTILREKVMPEAYSRAERQARVASQRVTTVLKEKAERAKSEAARDQGPGLFDGVDLK
jgi:hypothetical protein